MVTTILGRTDHAKAQDTKQGIVMNQHIKQIEGIINNNYPNVKTWYKHIWAMSWDYQVQESLIYSNVSKSANDK